MNRNQLLQNGVSSLGFVRRSVPPASRGERISSKGAAFIFKATVATQPPHSGQTSNAKSPPVQGGAEIAGVNDGAKCPFALRPCTRRDIGQDRTPSTNDATLRIERNETDNRRLKFT